MEGFAAFFGSLIAIAISEAWRTYFSEKAKNLATKEDIKGIESEIQEARAGYQKQLEAFRHELSLQLSRSGLRYQQEFEILKVLAAHLVGVRDAAAALRPVIDLVPADKSDEEVKRDRLTVLGDRMGGLYRATEEYMPFYPEEIRQSLLSLMRAAHKEAAQYAHVTIEHVGPDKYWDRVAENQTQIEQLAKESLEIIRKRVETWESPPPNPS